jgi:hypothetical protein
MISSIYYKERVLWKIRFIKSSTPYPSHEDPPVTKDPPKSPFCDDEKGRGNHFSTLQNTSRDLLYFFTPRAGLQDHATLRNDV